MSRDLLEIYRKTNSQEANDWVSKGLRLAETPKDRRGFKEFFEAADGDPCLQDDYRRASTALMMKNHMEWLSRVTEATVSGNVSGFIDALLPVIMAGFSQQIAHDLVSVQPLERRIGQVFFLNYRIGQDKGSAYVRGQRVFDAWRGFRGGFGYTDESIEGEDQGQTTASATVSGTLDYIPIRRSSVVITIAQPTPIVVRDNGNGGFVVVSGVPTIASSSIDYETGAWTITFSAALTAGTAIIADYFYDSEMSPTLPILDVELTASAISVKRRAIRLRYSMDGLLDFQMEFGKALDQTLIQGVSEFTTAEQAREIIHDLWVAAGAPVATFPRTPPVGAAYSRTEHFRDLMETINIARNAMYLATQRAEPNWCVVDTNAASLIRTMPRPMFEPAAIDVSTVGVKFIGVLQGLRVFVDPHLQDEPGASADGNILLGYKGTEYWDAGYIWAPYQTFQTQNIVLDDMVNRQAIVMRYAKKLINPNMYKRIALTP